MKPCSSLSNTKTYMVLSENNEFIEKISKLFQQGYKICSTILDQGGKNAKACTK